MMAELHGLDLRDFPLGGLVTSDATNYSAVVEPVASADGVSKSECDVYAGQRVSQGYRLQKSRGSRYGQRVGRTCIGVMPRWGGSRLFRETK